MSLITIVRRRIRLARLRAAQQQARALRTAYTEQADGLAAHIARLERDLVLSAQSSSASASDIASAVERRAKQRAFD